MTRPNTQITAEQLRALVHYDQENGQIIWLKSGRVARAVTYGYLRLFLLGRWYSAHRLAWLYVYGEHPLLEIDHINGERADNRIANLRQATISQQRANSRMKRTNQCGFKGVHWHISTQKWRAMITRDRKVYRLGLFETPEQAHRAYVAAAERLFGEFARAA